VSVGTAIMLLGLFAVPVGLLWAGHRLRRRSARWRAAFWGGMIGYGISACVAMVAGMIPPESWTADDRMRGFLAFWSLFVLPIIGATLGAARRARG
jgi:hypothetical protein